jgi:hypothetical protein
MEDCGSSERNRWLITQVPLLDRWWPSKSKTNKPSLLYGIESGARRGFSSETVGCEFGSGNEKCPSCRSDDERWRGEVIQQLPLILLSNHIHHQIFGKLWIDERIKMHGRDIYIYIPAAEFCDIDAHLAGPLLLGVSHL